MLLAHRFFQTYTLPSPEMVTAKRALKPGAVVHERPQTFRTSRILQLGIEASPAAVAGPVTILEPVAAIESVAAAFTEFPCEPAVDTSWGSPKIIFLFLLAGNAQIRLTDPSGLSVVFVVKRAGKYARKGRRYFVDVPGLRGPGGTIDEHDTFHANPGFERCPETMLFSCWYEDVQKHNPSRIAARHVGSCGRCSRPLTDKASVLCGVGPKCHFAVFGVHRTVAKTVGTIATLRAPKLPKVTGFEYVQMHGRAPNAYSIRYYIMRLAEAQIQLNAAIARGDTACIEQMKKAVDRQQATIRDYNPSIDDLRAISADHASKAAAKTSLRGKRRTDDGLARLEAETAKYIYASGLAAALADFLEQKAAVAPAA